MVKFSRKLFAAFGACAALVLTLGIFSYVQVRSLSHYTIEIGTNWMPSVQRLLEINSKLFEFRTYELQHILSTDAAEMARYDDELKKSRAAIDALDTAYQKLISSAPERQLHERFKGYFNERMAGHEKVVALSRQNKNEEALALARGEVSKIGAQMGKELELLIELNSKGASTEVEHSQQAAGFATMMLPVAVLIALGLAFGLAVVMVRSVMRELGAEPEEAKRVVSRIASGDLVEPVPVRAGDTTSLLAAMSAMQAKLADVVRGIAEGSGQIRTASEEVARGNLDLSSRTEQQASSLQETASSMEQITGNVRQSAQNAGQASTLAKQANDSADRGQHTIGGVVTTMHEIAANSAKVENIIGVIDSIAFQTNILALNAAVEAARAGEQGRGFAVVAAEVRSLAQRSADAAREIKQLIQESTARVGDGTRQVDTAKGAMVEIQSAIAKVADMIGEISAASTEQLAGIEQINQAVSQLDSVTQQNAALVEEASAATQSMTEQSGRLATAVQQFRVSHSSHAPAPIAAHKPATAAGPSIAPKAKVKGKPDAPRKAAAQPQPAAAVPAAAGAASASDDWNEF